MTKKRNIGSGLIEVIIVSSMLTIILLPIHQRFFDIFTNQEINNQYLIASGILENKIAFLRTQTKDQLILGEQNESIATLPQGNLNIEISDHNPSQPTIYRIDLDLTWQGKGSAKQAILNTLVVL